MHKVRGSESSPNLNKEEIGMNKWRSFKNMPKEGDVCWVWIRECYFDELLMEDYKEGMFVNIKETDDIYGMREDGSVDKDIVEKNARNMKLFIDENGYVIGDGSGTDYYKWKPTTAQFHLNTWEKDTFKQHAIDLYHKHQKDFLEEYKDNEDYSYNVNYLRSKITTKVEMGWQEKFSLEDYLDEEMLKEFQDYKKEIANELK